MKFDLFQCHRGIVIMSSIDVMQYMKMVKTTMAATKRAQIWREKMQETINVKIVTVLPASRNLAILASPGKGCRTTKLRLFSVGASVMKVSAWQKYPREKSIACDLKFSVQHNIIIIIFSKMLFSVKITKIIIAVKFGLVHFLELY